MKKAFVWFALFAAGLAIAGVFGDLIDAAAGAGNRISAAFAMSAAQKCVSAEKYEDAAKLYEKASSKTSPSNKKLSAKIKNNSALCVFALADKKQDVQGYEKSIKLFEESLEIYLSINDKKSAKEVETNLQTARLAAQNSDGAQEAAALKFPS